MVDDMYQYIHKVSRIARDNPKQMALAAKILAQERPCEEYLARAKDQLFSFGQGYEDDEAYEQFNVVQTHQCNHHLPEKGNAESIEPMTEAAPRMLETRPHLSIYSKMAAGMVCSREELLSNLSMVEIEATCGAYYIPEVHPDSPDYAPSSSGDGGTEGDTAAPDESDRGYPRSDRVGRGANGTPDATSVPGAS